jgi:hypothetical protein
MSGCGRINAVSYQSERDNAFFYLTRLATYADDSRDRFKHEIAFNDFVRDGRSCKLPLLLASDEQASAALYEFVEGDQLSRGDVEDGHMQQALEFLIDCNQHVCEKDGAGPHREFDLLPQATESCFSLCDHVAVVDSRVAKLEGIDECGAVSKAALEFVHGELLVAWKQMRKRCVDASSVDATDSGVDGGLACDQFARIVSPSDFGFHNAIEKPSGDLCFVDFEYAGWDDPCKTICDFFLQPAVPADRNWIGRYVDAVGQLISNPSEMRRRFELLWPVYGIKWCCIVMNEFLPTGASRRQFAKHSTHELQRDKQLQLAKSMFASIESEY